MGEEGTELRLKHLEDKDKVRDIKQDAMSDKIVIIEKLNIKQDVSLTIIVWISKALLTAFIGLIASNIWMYLDSK